MTEPPAWDEVAVLLARVLGARGYPVPVIIWHGMVRDDWHVTVQNRLPGHPATTLDGPLLDEVLRLVGRQAGAAIPAGHLRDWLRPAWGLRLPPADFAHNDLDRLRAT